jgi:hypothetical protein
MTPAGAQGNLVVQLLGFDFSSESVHQLLGAVCQASGAGTDGDTGFIRLSLLLYFFLEAMQRVYGTNLLDHLSLPFSPVV